MILDEEFYFELSQNIIQEAQRINELLIELEKELALSLSKNPDATNQILRTYKNNRAKILALWEKKIIEFSQNDLAQAYTATAKGTQIELRALEFDTTGNIPSRQIFARNMRGSGFISPQMRVIFGELPEHLMPFSVFSAYARNELNQTIRPIIRSTDDTIRQLIVLSGESHFRESNLSGRKGFMDNFLKRSADSGITSVVYKNGARYNIESYAEMMSRTMFGHASAQATINTASIYGVDLVYVSQHQDPSPMCQPYQGRIFSTSGESKKYKPLQDALDGGLFHPNCRHSITPYTGVKPDFRVDPKVKDIYDKMGTKEGQKFVYKKSQELRRMENNYRKYKRRSIGMLDSNNKKNAEKLMDKWEKKVFEFQKKHPYLRTRIQYEK